MRIVGGEHRGRKLRVPPGKSTRPTTERVREALFNVLGPSVRDQAVLDLYAGSGSLGIEALSRGAGRVVFVEMGRVAADIIRDNLAGLELDESQALVVQRAIEKSLDRLRELGPFDLCLVDPPFPAVRNGIAIHTLEQVASSPGILGTEALVILEFPSDQPAPLFEKLACEQIRAYGDTRLAFLRPISHNRHLGLGG